MIYYLKHRFMSLFLLLLVSVSIQLVYLKQLERAVQELSVLHEVEAIEKSAFSLATFPKISVIIPAFNEEDNIHDCVISVLSSSDLTTEFLEVWVVDDHSTDETLMILQTLQQSLRDPRLKLIPGLPRPEGQVWIGKNWACAQAAECAGGEFLLFIDADVRLKPGAIEAALQAALSEHVDLLNCIPALVCGSLAEWLVQPLMFINMLVSFNSAVVKDPNTETAFAGGFFLLFRRSAYEQVGGHRAVASQVAEDVALARLIKRSGLKLQYVLGASVASLRMYRSWAALWEGWTKVLYVSVQRNWLIMLYLALVMLSIYSVPWLGLAIILGKSLVISLKALDLIVISAALIAILLEYNLRSLAAQALHSSPKYWWLDGLGGLLVAVIAVVSVIKTETGWGWTWRGRSLKQPTSPSNSAS